MTWEYALIGLAVGLIIGALAMRFGSRKLREQQSLQKELEKNKQELEQHRQELVGYFAHSAELLDNMARDYRKLYQHMANSSNQLLPDLPVKENPFNFRLTQSSPENTVDENEHASVNIPKDYSEGASGLLRAERREQ